MKILIVVKKEAHKRWWHIPKRLKGTEFQTFKKYYADQFGPAKHRLKNAILP
jgi:hypothetical protein